MLIEILKDHTRIDDDDSRSGIKGPDLIEFTGVDDDFVKDWDRAAAHTCVAALRDDRQVLGMTVLEN